MTIRIETNRYQNSLGRKPSGGTEMTSWFFQIGNETKEFRGKWSTAKAEAVEYAKSVSAFFVVVLP